MSSNGGNGPRPGNGSEDNGNHPPSNSNQDHTQSEIDIFEEVKLTKRSGRGIRRLVTLCGSITQLVVEYDRRLPGSESDDDGDDEDTSPQGKEEVQKRRNRDYQSYLELAKLIPSFKEKIANPHEGSRLMYYARLLSSANNARSDDISRMKWTVADLLNRRTNHPAEPPLDLNDRSGRGLQNDFTGRLLCPIKYDWEDPVIRTKIRNETDGYSASNDYWLRCLYEGENGNPEDVEKGFLKSSLLVKTFQTIFTSPSSAGGNLDAQPVVDAPVVPQSRNQRKKKPAKRPSVAVQLGMNDQVTVRAIAYAAVQLHFSLCDAEHWMINYNGFNYEEFYEFIVDFFEADQTPEGKAAAKELYNWWNRKVFPKSVVTRAASSTSVRQSSYAILQEQRRARLSRTPI